MNDSIPFFFSKSAHVCNGGLFLPNGRGTHPRRVINSYELIFVRSGTLAIAEEEQEYLLQAGEYLILFPEHWHFGTKEYGEDLSFYWFHFDLEPKTPCGQAMYLQKYGRAANATNVINLFNLFIGDQESGFCYEPIKQMLFALILCELTRPQMDEERVGRAIAWASRAQSYIKIHFCEQITRYSIADAIGCSADYLGRVYQRVYHKKISDTIHDCRINHAGKMLHLSSKPVTEIAQACGYPDIRIFRQQFKSRNGVTPQQYRTDAYHGALQNGTTYPTSI